MWAMLMKFPILQISKPKNHNGKWIDLNFQPRMIDVEQHLNMVMKFPILQHSNRRDEIYLGPKCSSQC
jgi:hypothetical protein